jgi:hypothetical protein
VCSRGGGRKMHEVCKRGPGLLLAAGVAEEHSEG